MLLAPAKRKTANRGPVVRPETVVAPIGGWNVRDSIANMKPTEAVILDNWFPTTTDCQLRKGYTVWASGMTGNVETIVAYNPPGGAKKLFAFTSAGNLYDITASGAVGGTVLTGLANGRWQYVNVGTGAGEFILAVNGSDNMLRFDGTNWVFVYPSATGAAISTIVGGGAVVTVTTTTPHGLRTGNTVTVSGCATAGYNVGPVAITVTGASTFTYANTTVGAAGGAPIYVIGEVLTGVSAANCININLFKNRVWLVQKNSLSMWYLATSSIQGAATEFPLGPLFPGGGSLQNMATWTIDAGVGIDDNAVFMSTEGEVLVYKGTDPASAGSFALVGLFKQGNPIGNRCQIKYMGDVYVITDQGVAPLSNSILTAQVTIKSDLTDKIQPAVAAAVALNKSTFGWQLIPYPSQNMLLMNVPASGANYQFVMNTITGAWCRFYGWSAYCWESQGNSLYFGAAGAVGLAWSSTTDNGASIVAEVLPAFNYFGMRGYNKDFKSVKPIFQTDGSPTILGVMNLDFDTTAPTGALAYSPPSSGMVWGSMTWGSMVWGGGLMIQKAWQNAVGGSGDAGAYHFKVQNNGSNVRLQAITYVFERGGIIG